METKSKKEKEKVLTEANKLMSHYATCNKARKDLLDTIMEELKGYENSAKETQLKLIELGERNMDMFEDNNLILDDGYLHIANNAKVVTGRKFDIKDFQESRPEWLSFELKLKEIKAAWLDKELNKELRSLGVSVDTVKNVEVKLNKEKS